jgi:hypothetical protein
VQCWQLRDNACCHHISAHCVSILLQIPPNQNPINFRLYSNVTAWYTIILAVSTNTMLMDELIFYEALCSTEFVILSKLEKYNNRDEIKGCKLYESKLSSISFIAVLVKYIILCHVLLYNP